MSLNAISQLTRGYASQKGLGTAALDEIYSKENDRLSLKLV